MLGGVSSISLNFSGAHKAEDRVASAARILPSLPINAVGNNAGLRPVTRASADRNLILWNAAMDARIAKVGL